ncbi:MAG: DUF296 domain-containing protein [Candidatus Diapherotrites archaeon]|nr:DUF296 domain-containing protein [Candidatus Diapherotrites archaeon]
MEKRLVLSFSDGDDILEGVRQAAAEHDVDFAKFHSANGCIKDFQIISDDYRDISSIADDYLVDKIAGRIMKQKDAHKINLHFTLVKKASGKTTPISGELRKGIVSGDLTIVLTLSDMKNIIH